jgi:hypothetical protein
LASNKANLQNEKTNLKTDVSKLTDAKNLLSEKIIKLETEAKDLNGKMSELTKNLADKTSSVTKLQSENRSLKQKYMCKDTLNNVDFSSNKTVNTALTSYVNRTKSLDLPVSANYWNLIWTGSKYSTHTVEVYSAKENMTYLWKFTVYYRGESYGDH